VSFRPKIDFDMYKYMFRIMVGAIWILELKLGTYLQFHVSGQCKVALSLNMEIIRVLSILD